MNLKRVVAVALVVLFAARAAGNEHLVSPADIQGALQEARDTRGEDLATVQAFLSRPEVTEAARSLGVDGQDLAARTGRLSDGELREIAARADALDMDPVAGGPGRAILAILGFIIVLAVVLVLLVIGGCYAEDYCN